MGDQASPGDAAAAARAVESGGAAYARADFTLAIGHYRTAVALFEKCGGLDLAQALCRLSSCYSTHARDSTAALACADRSFSVASALNQQDPLVTSLTVSCETVRGEAFSVLGRTTESTAAFKTALTLAECIGDPVRIAQLLIDIASNSAITGDVESGLLYLQRAESLTPPANYKLRTNLMLARGSLFRGSDRLPAAIECYRSALNAGAHVYGRCSRESASTLISIACAHNMLGRTAEAASFTESAAVILQSLGATASGDFSTVLMLRGAGAIARGEHVPALVHLNLALDLQRQLFPPSHPSIAITLRNISAVQGFLGRDEEATRTRSAALAINRRYQVACAGPGCERKLREDGAPLDVCVRCRCTFYCGKACQTADWKAGHRAECKALIAAAAAAE